MAEFWLIRHGSTDALGRSISGWQPGVSLSAAGEREVRALAARCGSAAIGCVYSSPLERTLSTARALAGRVGCALHEDAELGELHFGEWTGASFEALHGDPRWHGWNSFRCGTRAPGGELMLEAQTRAVRSLLRLREQHAEQRVAIVSHGDVIKGLLCYFLGMPLDLHTRLEISPASISQLDLGADFARVARINDCAHLEPV
jgi:broad specificity phosphatase PhoE